MSRFDAREEIKRRHRSADDVGDEPHRALHRGEPVDGPEREEQREERVLALGSRCPSCARERVEPEVEKRRREAREEREELRVPHALGAARERHGGRDEQRRQGRKAHVVFALKIGEIVAAGVRRRRAPEIEPAIEPRLGEQREVVVRRVRGEPLAPRHDETNDRDERVDERGDEDGPSSVALVPVERAIHACGANPTTSPVAQSRGSPRRRAGLACEGAAPALLAATACSRPFRPSRTKEPSDAAHSHSSRRYRRRRALARGGFARGLARRLGRRERSARDLARPHLGAALALRR